MLNLGEIIVGPGFGRGMRDWQVIEKLVEDGEATTLHFALCCGMKKRDALDYAARLQRTFGEG